MYIYITLKKRVTLLSHLNDDNYQQGIPLLQINTVILQTKIENKRQLDTFTDQNYTLLKNAKVSTVTSSQKGNHGRWLPRIMPVTMQIYPNDLSIDHVHQYALV